MLYWKSKHSEDINGGFDFVGSKGASTAMPGGCWTFGRFFYDSHGTMYYSRRVRAIIGGHKPGEMGFGLFRYDESKCTWTVIGGLAEHIREGTYGKVLVWEKGGMAAGGWYQGFLSNLTFDKDNTLHLFTGINSNPKVPGNNRAIYAMSWDGGYNWVRKDLSPIIGLPLRAADNLPNAAYVVEKSAHPFILHPKLLSRSIPKAIQPIYVLMDGGLGMEVVGLWIWA